MRAVAAFTFKEALRRRLVLAAGVLTSAFLALFGFVAHAAVAHAARDPLIGAAGGVAWAMVGVFLARSFSGLLAILVSVGAISGEIESGSLQSVFVRPTRRSSVLFGKFLGYGVMLVCYTAALQGAVLVVAWAATGVSVGRPWEVLGLLCLEPLVLLSLTLFGSTFLPTLANGAAAVLLYGVCVIGGFIEQIGALAGPRALEQVGIVISLVLPADAMYRKAFSVVADQVANPVLRQLLGPMGNVVAPSWAMVVYGVCYIVALTTLAAWVVSRRDV